jgi:hypothetical protein
MKDNNMNKTTPHVLTVTVADSSSYDKIEISLSKYSDINDWIKVFKTILIHQTFCEDTVKELFEDPLEEDKSIDYSATLDWAKPWNEPIGTPVGKEAW